MKAVIGKRKSLLVYTSPVGITQLVSFKMIDKVKLQGCVWFCLFIVFSQKELSFSVCRIKKRKGFVFVFFFFLVKCNSKKDYQVEMIIKIARIFWLFCLQNEPEIKFMKMLCISSFQT